MKITIIVPHTTNGEDTSYSVRVDRDEAIRLGAKKVGAVKIGTGYYYLDKETNSVYRMNPLQVVRLGAGEVDGRGMDCSLWASSLGCKVYAVRQSIMDVLKIEWKIPDHLQPKARGGDDPKRTRALEALPKLLRALNEMSLRRDIHRDHRWKAIEAILRDDFGVQLDGKQ